MSDNIHVLNLSAYKNPIITESKRDEWVEFGEDNNFYQFLLDSYTNSTTNSAIINSISRLIYGRGLSAVDASRKPNEYAQMMALFSADCLRKIGIDRKMLGQFAFQVHYNDKHDKILKAYHLPVNLLRSEKCNADGEIEGYYYSDDWTDTKKFKPKRFSAFGTSNDKIEVLYFKPYSVGMKYYNLPEYQGCLPYAVLENKISNYLINDVENGFSGRTLINMNYGKPTPEQQTIISNKIINKLTGDKGQPVIVSFNNNKEEAATIESIPLNDAPEHYTYLSEECVRKIMLGHSVTSPLIFGIANASGFSSNADELKNSFILFNNMVIKPMQDEIIEALDQILAFNDISLNLFFKTLKPLEFTDLENAQSTDQVAEETGTNLSAQSELDTILAMVDENQLGAEWSEVDARDAGDNDEELDIALMEAESNLEPKQSLLSKVYNFVQTGSPKPNQKSAQDRKVGELKYFKVRYRYTGNKTPDREFCTAMMAKQDRLFRKEDIDEMSRRAVNPGFGEGGKNTYDIFRFKGGARCKHKFERVTFMLDLNKTEKGYSQIGTRAAEVKGYKVTNPYEVSIYPNNLPLKGFSPNNTNLPSDAK